MSKCNKHRYVSTSPKVCVVCLLSQLATKEATIAELGESLNGALNTVTTQADFMAELEATIAELKGLLRRYRNETPLGHQPHMITEQVDAALLEKNDERME